MDKLSLNSVKMIKETLSPLLKDYYEHQGWKSVDNADEQTAKILAALRSMGVNL